MEQDFHFCAVYALSRVAGFAAKDAQVIAYSSQYTDDAYCDEALEFENGGYFHPVLTSYKLVDPNVISTEVCYRIWVPFHFLPGNSGTTFRERLLTRPGSSIAQEVVGDLLASEKKPYLLHRLGIVLHLCADTWSHQGFMGIKNPMNDVDDLTVDGEDDNSVLQMLDKWKNQVISALAPQLGHTQAAHFPDEPYRTWEYQDYQKKRWSIRNSDRAMDAARKCFDILQQFLRRFPEYASSSTVPWGTVDDRFAGLFATEGNLQERKNTWKRAIADGTFIFDAGLVDSNISYDDRAWFDAAVKVASDATGRSIYERRPGFEASNWKCFHDAADRQRFSILHEILPSFGMFCG